MKVWVSRNSQTYALAGKFPYTLIEQLLVERKIEPADVLLSDYNKGYKVLSPFSLESGGLVLNINSDFIITGD